VVTVGVVRGGTADNVIPSSVRLEGTLRSFDAAVRQQLVQDVERAMAVVRAFGGDYTLRIERGYPPLVNAPIAAGWLRQVAGDLLGDSAVSEGNVSMGAEDFAYMTQRAPGAMFALGVQAPGGEARYLHTPTFDLDEDALPIGAAILAETALRYVRGEFNS
jgi:amidohydrolase